MRVISLLLHPALVSITALFLALIWMLRDEKDRTRVELVFALIINLMYGVLFHFFMGSEGAVFPLKFDYVLACLDASLGIQVPEIVCAIPAFFHVPLWLVYEAMIPMMIAWYFLTRYRRHAGSIVLAYAAELVTGPLLYAIVPACGPLYAFGRQWQHPPNFPPIAVRLAGMPNAFPSLHVATAFVFLIFAPGKIWKAVALLFLAATCLAILSTGEHYVIDMIPGLAFGVFAASVGMRNFRLAASFLALALCWSLGVRFGSTILLTHPFLLRSFAGLTLMLAILALSRLWSAVTALEKPEADLVNA